MLDTSTYIDKQYDLVVAGGGIAGLCAAIAAARQGVKTAIIQDRPVFGGNSSSEIGIGPCGSVYYNAWAMETGIIEELMLEDRSRNHEDLSDAGKTNSVYDIVLYEKARAEKNLDIYLNTSVIAVDTEAVSKDQGETGKILKSVYASQQRSEKSFRFYANQFMDCTGDGTVAYLAGAEFRYGRESRAEFDEYLAPLNKDNHIMGSSIAIMARNVGKPVIYRKPDWAMDYRTLEEIGPYRDVGRLDKSTFSGFWWMEVGSPFHQIEDYDAIKDQLLAHVLGVWNYIKNYSSQQKEAENYALEWIGMLPGKRESRRITGDVTVSEKNAHKDESWADSVCCSGWFLDIHINGGILNKKEPPELSHQDSNYHNHSLVAPFTMPLRAMYSKDIGNLWMAGRNVSVTRAILASVRMQLILGNLGQAVGTAAAYAVKKGLTPKQVSNPCEKYIKEIQQQIIKDDVQILGIQNTDQDDLARNVKIFASSELPLDFGEPDLNEFKSLERPLAQVFPATTNKLEELEFYLSNESDCEQTVTVELHRLERIWDQQEGILVTKGVIKLAPHFSGWIKWEAQFEVEPQHPYRVALYAANTVKWAKSGFTPVGTLSQYLYESKGGAEAKNSHLPSLQPEEMNLPAFRKWNQPAREKYCMSLRISPEQMPYGAGNINNGYAWPCTMPNLWISAADQSLPQCLEIHLDQRRPCSSIHVTFDTNLNVAHSRMPGFWKAPMCPKDWNLYVWKADAWELVYSEKGNYQRKRVVSFKTVKTDRLKLEILATNGGENAGVYEIRVY